MDVIEEKIRTLLSQGSEHEKLDYKRLIDLDEKHDEVEITKDIAAMLSTGGGSLLLGADDNGIPSSDFTKELYDKFDETKLRGKLKRYINEPFEVRVSGAQIDGHYFRLIECDEYEDGFVVIKSIGQYNVGGQRDKVIFVPGDVFVRHGSASEKWQQHDIKRIVKSQVDKVKVNWIKDAHLLMTGLNNVTDPNAESKDVLKTVFKDFRKRLNNSEISNSDITLTVDKITAISIQAAQSNNTELFELSIKTLHDTYGLGFDTQGSWRQNNGFDPVNLWYEILIRLPLIGGACIEAGEYMYAKKVVLQGVQGTDSEFYSNWYRHAFTMSVRASYTPRDSDNQPMSFLSATTALFREDPLYRELLDWDSDSGRVYIVRFDYLAGIFIMDSSQNNDVSETYPSFAFYEKNKIVPMVIDIILDDQKRVWLFKSKKENIAYIIKALDLVAEQESRHFWRTRWQNTQISEFLEDAEPFNE